MTSLRRMIRNRLEKMLGRFYEGPSAPERLAKTAETFRILHPEATAEEWQSFAALLAEGAYRDGYTRGFEWTERAPELGPKHAPEELAEMQASEYERIVQAQNAPLALTPAQETQLIADLGAATGGWQVVPVEDDLP